MNYKTFEIKNGKLILNNEHSATPEPSDIDIFLDADYEPEYGSDLIEFED